MLRAFRYASSAVALTALAVLVLAPESVWSAMPAVCLYRNLLDAECLGCGMTRALAALFHGRWQAAFETNAGVAVAASALAAAALQALWIKR